MNETSRLLFGPELRDDGSALFRLWAPSAREVALRLEGHPAPSFAMSRQPGGWFACEVARCGAGHRYRFCIDDEVDVPDPASRLQAGGVEGPSELFNPNIFRWSDASWPGRAWEELVFYELHVGTFGPRGDYAGVIERLDELVALGVTAIELMPLAECPGARNWGYDGVLPFAPASRYGRPEDLMRLIDEAHRHRLAVFLDVVYNHFGPVGNYLGRYARPFFTERHRTPWGAAIDFEGPQSQPVREFFIENALHWLDAYHFDGLRLDAVHAIHDDGPAHFLDVLSRRVHRSIGDARRVHLVLENDRNETRWLERGPDGRAAHYAAQWNDDFHHALHVVVTGEHSGYYRDYADDPVERLGRCLTEGFDYQGEPSAHRGGEKRGEPSRSLPLPAFVNFLQNHDQVGNRAYGERIAALASPDAVRAATAILLLAPSIPLLFMGQEWGSDQPFLFFCDFDSELSAHVREGRRREFRHFPEFRDPAARERIPDPTSASTFASSVLHWEERERPPGSERLAFHRELLELRHREIVPRLVGIRGDDARFQTFDDAGLLARWTLGDHSRLTLLAQLSTGRGGSAPPDRGERLLFLTSSDPLEALGPGALAPWTVAWFLDA